MSKNESESTKAPADLSPENGKTDGSRLSEKAIRAIQGNGEERTNSGRKGSNFEQWANVNVFKGEGHRLSALPEDNEHLDKYGDDVGLTKGRRSDSYINKHGEIWELKSGYEKGGIDYDQLLEYSIMEDAGHVKIRDAEGQMKDMPVKSVNYLFETKAGAAANAADLKGRATVWYVDDQGRVNLFTGDT